MGKLLTSAGRDAPRTWDIPAMNYKLEAWLAVWILAMEASLHAFNLPASAHHAFAAEYDNEQPITLSGTLTKLVWANPHCWIYVDVKDVRSGAVVSWSIELGSTNALLRQGLRGTDFLAGEVVTVRGYLAKGSPNVANGVGIRLLDGRNLFTGS
jgi:hypothetical protein